MPSLYKTEAALADLAGTQHPDFGFHGGNMPTSGSNGVMIGEVPFDASIHSPEHINPFSIMQMANTMPGMIPQQYVSLVIPEKPLMVKVITHHQPGIDDPRISEGKFKLASDLRESITDSMPGMTDRVFGYHIGDLGDYPLDYDTHVVKPETDDPEAEAYEIARLCQDSLAFVISDFKRLRLDSQPKSSFGATIAVKANHPLDLALPANSGRISVASGESVNTKKSKELNEYNAELQAKNQLIIDRLRSAGIEVARVALTRRSKSGFNYDTEAVDTEIARAVDRINYR